MYAHHQHANERGHRQYSSALEIEGWEWEQDLLKQSERKKKGSKYVSMWRVDIRPRIKGGNGSHQNDDCSSLSDVANMVVNNDMRWMGVMPSGLFCKMMLMSSSISSSSS